MSAETFFEGDAFARLPAFVLVLMLILTALGVLADAAFA
jgi:hypothetical protein